MKKKHLILPVFIFLFTSAQSQIIKESMEKKKFTLYELLSSYYEDDFKPFKKGNVYFGLSMSLEEKQSENTEGLFQKVLDGNRVNFNILLKGGYYIHDYSMIGLNVNIYENKFVGSVFKDPDTVQSNTITRGFSITPNLRTIIPVTENERLNFFTTVGLTLGKSNTLKRDVKYVDEIEKSFAENYNVRIGLSPGVTYFAMENFALEVQLDALGYELNVEKRELNGVEKSQEVRHNVDFKINLLSMKLGLTYYFKNKKNK